VGLVRRGEGKDVSDEIKNAFVFGGPEGRPIRVCLCGSTRFMEAYARAMRDETLAGKIVLTVGMLGHQEKLGDGRLKAMLDSLHMHKVHLCDEVLVLDCFVPFCLVCNDFVRSVQDSPTCDYSHGRVVRPYIGLSTKREIAYTESLGKRVRYLSKEVKT
jgi:hypothetical protein